MPPLEEAVFDNSGNEPLRESLRRWAQGLLFDHDFAKAVFGYDQVDEFGQGFYLIRMVAIQTAVEHEGELFKVDPSRPTITMVKTPVLDHAYKISDMTFADTSIEYPDKVTYDLKRMVGQVPFKTHRITEIEVEGGQPSWQYHIKQMAVSENPFLYINDFIDKQIAKREVTEPNVV